MNIEMHSMELSEEDGALLEKLLDANDEAAVNEFLKKRTVLYAAKRAMQKMKCELVEGVLRNAHFLLHEGRHDEALMLLCPLVALIDGDVPPAEVIHAVRDKMEMVNSEREKHACRGNA